MNSGSAHRGEGPGVTYVVPGCGNALSFSVACNLSFYCSCTVVKKNRNVIIKKTVTKSPQRSFSDLPSSDCSGFKIKAETN